MKERKNWIDWMKALGMLAIIWGHCFPDGMSEFIYAFNVPVFFIISGYLAHTEPSWRVCVSKCWRTLALPYLVLALIKCAGYMLRHISDGQWLWSLGAVLGGFHSLHGVEGCGNLWFVYTLIIVKLLYQASEGRRSVVITLSALLLTCAVCYNHSGYEWRWALTNTCLAFPAFVVGRACSSSCKGAFDRFVALVNRTPYALTAATVLLLAAATYVVGRFNGSAQLYMGLYGHHLALFALGALAGSLMVLLISLMLDHLRSSVVRIISSGTILILVFHRDLLHPFLKMIDNAQLPLLPENLLIFALCVAVLLVFVPIILVVRRLAPFLLGGRKG